MGTLALKIKTHFLATVPELPHTVSWWQLRRTPLAEHKSYKYIRAKDLFLSLVPTCVVTSSFSTRGNTLWSQPPPRWTLIQNYGFCSKRIHKTGLLFLRSWSFCAASASSYFSKKTENSLAWIHLLKLCFNYCYSMNRQLIFEFRSLING